MPDDYAHARQAGDGPSEAEQAAAITKLQAIARGRAQRREQKRTADSAAKRAEDVSPKPRQVDAGRSRSSRLSSQPEDPEMVAAATKLQAIARGRAQRKMHEREQKEMARAATKLQAAARGRAQRKEQKEMANAATKLQSVCRSRAARKVSNKKRRKKKKAKDLGIAEEEVEESSDGELSPARHLGEITPAAALDAHGELVRLIEDAGTNARLKTLDLTYKYLGDAGAERLAKALTRSMRLQVLELKGNFIGCHGAERLAAALVGGCPLVRLGLSWNNIGCRGATRLSVAVAEEVPTLTDLDLSHNRIADEGAKWLAQAVMKSRSLIKVGVQGNMINKVGLEALSASEISRVPAVTRRGAVTAACDVERPMLEMSAHLNSAVERPVTKTPSTLRWDIAYHGTNWNNAPFLNDSLRIRAGASILVQSQYGRWLPGVLKTENSDGTVCVVVRLGEGIEKEWADFPRAYMKAAPRIERPDSPQSSEDDPESEDPLNRSCATSREAQSKCASMKSGSALGDSRGASRGASTKSGSALGGSRRVSLKSGSAGGGSKPGTGEVRA